MKQQFFANEKIARRSNVLMKHVQPFDNAPASSASSSSLLQQQSSQQQSFLLQQNQQLAQEDTCGIIAYVSKEKEEDQANKYLLEGLFILQNRGYDSAGIATVATGDAENKLVVSKFASLQTTSDALQRLKANIQAHYGHSVGIAHTRWATHGAKTDKNAHPHCDRLERIALVHNGVIENSHELREELHAKHNITFKSETDTEVIAQLIGIYLDAGKDLLEAVQQTISRLEGTWGLVIISKKEPDRMIAVRNGSPLLIGLSRGKMFVASESSAFARHTREMIALENGEIAIVTADGVQEIMGQQQKEMKDRVMQAPDVEVEISPYPYPHWTIKEIFEQPEAISRSLNYGGRFDTENTVKLGGLDSNKDWLLDIKHLVIAACGTSYYASNYGAKVMRAFKCFDSVQVLDAAELEPEDFPPEKAGLLVISQSGETADVVRCLTMAEQLNIPRFSIVNKVGSLISRTTGCGVYINAGREVAVASTKAFSCQVTVLSLVALFFAQNRHSHQFVQERKNLITALHRTPTSVGMILNGIRNQCKDIAKKLLGHNTLFILGKGMGESIAKEGSLKIKEITYTHAEAYPSGALKHGPFALIDKGTPIFIIVLDDKHRAHNMTAVHEVMSRGAQVFVITDVKEKVKDVVKDQKNILVIPHNGIMTPLLGVIPLQLIAYELAVLKNIDPDKPRNLAKSVTVL